MTSPFSFAKAITACLALVALSATAASANAIAIDEASFVAPTTVVFSTRGIWGGPYPVYSENGATFNSPEPDYFYTYPRGADYLLDLWFVTNSSLDVSFDQTVGQFGFHAGTNAGSAPPEGAGMNDYIVESVQFFSDDNFVNLVDTYATPTTLSQSGQPQAQTFFGLQSSNAFQSIRINFSNPGTGGGFSPYMDDFLFETAAPVPDAGSAIALLGMGLGFVGVARWRMARR